jgi:hypothetical protein
MVLAILVGVARLRKSLGEMPNHLWKALSRCGRSWREIVDVSRPRSSGGTFRRLQASADAGPTICWRADRRFGTSAIDDRRPF